jgi:hypothetical protein
MPKKKAPTVQYWTARELLRSMVTERTNAAILKPNVINASSLAIIYFDFC